MASKHWPFVSAKMALNKLVVIPTYNKAKTLEKLAQVEKTGDKLIVGEELMRHCIYYKITEFEGIKIAINGK